MIFDKLFKKDKDAIKTTETKPVSAVDYYAEGKAQFDAGHYTQAMEYFQAAIAEHPERENAYLKLADTFLAMGKQKEASSSLHKLLARYPDNRLAQEKVQLIQQQMALLPPGYSTISKSEIQRAYNESLGVSSHTLSDTQTHSTIGKGCSSATLITRDDAVTAQLFRNNVFLIDLPWGVHNRIYIEKMNGSECMVVPPLGKQDLAWSCETDCWKGFAKPRGQVSIPSFVRIEEKQYTITLIGDGAFSFCEKLSKITLPQTIRKVGRYAFYSTSIRDPHLPDSIVHICNDAFSMCKQLHHINIPASLEKIPNKFLSGTAVQYLEIPPSVKYIGDDFIGPLRNVNLTLKMHGEPPRITPKTFYKMLTVNVNVPKRLYNSYASAMYWQQGKNLIPY